jgi:hypothetical protein
VYHFLVMKLLLTLLSCLFSFNCSLRYIYAKTVVTCRQIFTYIYDLPLYRHIYKQYAHVYITIFMYAIYRLTSTRCFRLRNSQLHATIEEPLMEVQIIVRILLSIHKLLYILVCMYACLYLYIYIY